MIENIYLYEVIPNNLLVNGDALIDWVAEPEITRQINGEFGLFGTYSLKGQHVDLIKKGMFVKAKWENKTWQYFEIRDTIKDLTTLSINAVHIGYMANRNFIENSFTSNGNGQTIMNNLKDSQSFTQRFDFKSTVASHHQFTAKQVNTIEAIIGSNNGQQNLVGVTGGELDMDNFNLNLKEKIGEDNGYRIDFGINLESIEEHVDDISVVNSLYLIGAVPEDADYDSDQEPVTFSFLEVEGVNDTNRKIGKRENGDCKTIEELKEWGQSLFDVGRIHEPKSTHEVNMIMLENTEEYKGLYDNINRLGFGDTAYVMLKQLNIEVVERMVACVWLPRLNKYKEVTLGNELSTYTSSVNTAVQNVVTKLENKSEQLLNAVVNATNWITGTVGGYVRFRPKNAPSEILIMDTDNVDTAQKVWRWNLGGLGYSKKGVNGPFELAMTQDGVFVADFIKAGTIQADVFESSFNGTGDTLKLVKGTLQILNQKNKIMELTKKGLEFWRGNDSIGTIGTTGTDFSWVANEPGKKFDRALEIGLNGGEFIKISNDDEDGISLPKSGPGKLTLWDKRGIDVTNGRFGISITDRGVEINGKLFVGGKEIIPGGQGGGWNGTYPPEVITDTEKRAWQVWITGISKGHSQQSIAGEMGNIDGAEAPGFNPTASEGGNSPGYGYGLVQWTDSTAQLSGRDYMIKLMGQANITDDPDTIKAQMKLIDWHAKNGQWIPTSGYPYSWESFKGVTDVTEATYAFLKNFERAGVEHAQRRVDSAIYWYNKFKDLKVPTGKYGMPVPPGYTITSWFGDRDDPMDPGNLETHKGMDFGDALGTPIFAASAGVVSMSLATSASGGFGEYVVIKNTDGNYTGYGHMTARMVNAGQSVSQGQQIGTMGSTGQSTGSHLHFSVGSGDWGPYQDPAPYLGLTRP